MITVGKKDIMDNVFKGFINRLSHDCHIDIDRNVSTACCRFSSGNSVDLLRRTICTAMVGTIIIIIMVYLQ